MKQLLILSLAFASAVACRSPKPQALPVPPAVEAVKKPMYDVPHAALKSALRTAVGDERSVGTLKVDFGGKSFSAKLDLRVAVLEEKIKTAFELLNKKAEK